MNDGTDDVRWLSEPEMLAWRSYVVASLMLRHRLHRELAETHDLSLVDYEVLVVLSGEPGGRMRMSELAAMLGSTKSRLSHQVGRMETTGLLVRAQDPADKRGVMAEITEAGAELLRSCAPTHVLGVRGHLIDLLDENEQQVIGQAFTRVLAHLSEGEN